jgi:hypothetical protein
VEKRMADPGRDLRRDCHHRGIAVAQLPRRPGLISPGG